MEFQDSSQGSLLFDIVQVCDMFAIAEKHDIASYAEDIHYSGSQDTENVTLRNYQKFFFSDIFSAK